MTFFGHVIYWHQHHVMSMASSMAPLHFFSQDNQNEVQHNPFGHVMHDAGVSVSHDAIPFHLLGHDNQNEMP